MSNINDIVKVKAMLSSALNSALNSLGSEANEAKSHIRSAINKLDVVAKKQIRKKQQNETPKNVAKTVSSPFANFADNKSLARLNAMIDETKNEINELEKKIQGDTDHFQNDDDELIQD